jgi:succinate-semialdehyde dehydrogenase/glutarate-semialdehyde dehydrogenase
MIIKSINPTDSSVIKIYETHTDNEIFEKVNDTHQAWLTWKETDIEKRTTLLVNLSNVLQQRKQELAKLMALEMGKPIKQGIIEIEKCAAVCTYYAENAELFLQKQLVETEAQKSFITYQPIGVILAVMPWNFPFWQVFRFLAPALAAGNCGVLKHASNVPGCALAIEEMIKKAGFPPNVFQTLLASSNQVDAIIDHEHVKAVTLTGSTQAGIKVTQKAGSVLKKTVLELGGSDAYIILEDADLELAATTCTDSRLVNSGQSCIAAKRFIVVEPVSKQFIQLMLEKMRKKQMGDPLNEHTDVGPQARKDLRDELHNQVLRSVHAGANCILGGEIPEGNNAFYPPTILINVNKDMPAFNEELFGPVAAIIIAQNEDHAIRLANDSVFGLGAAVFTKDVAKGELIASTKLDAGSCFVNSLVKSDPRLPFGGIKQSGYGRELGMLGMHEFLNIKTIYVR